MKSIISCEIIGTKYAIVSMGKIFFLQIVKTNRPTRWLDARDVTVADPATFVEEGMEKTFFEKLTVLKSKQINSKAGGSYTFPICTLDPPRSHRLFCSIPGQQPYVQPKHCMSQTSL